MLVLCLQLRLGAALGTFGQVLSLRLRFVQPPLLYNIIINEPLNDVTDGSAVTKEKCPNKLESIEPAQD